MSKLSVNVNKVATLRNSRGGSVPAVVDAVRVCMAAGAPGITVHPRADARHITTTDVREVVATVRDVPGVEFNIEGDPRPDLIALVHEVRPDQCTLVPVREGEVTSQAGWSPETPRAALEGVVSRPEARRDPHKRLRRSRSGGDLMGLDASAPIASSSTPSPSPARSKLAGRRGSRASSSTSPRRSTPTPSVSGSMPATISISRTWRSSGPCRTSTRCPSGTPSSATPCTSASNGPSAITSPLSPDGRVSVPISTARQIASVNSVVDAWPPRSRVRTLPASRTRSSAWRIFRPVSCSPM